MAAHCLSPLLGEFLFQANEILENFQHPELSLALKKDNETNTEKSELEQVSWSLPFFGKKMKLKDRIQDSVSTLQTVNCKGFKPYPQNQQLRKDIIVFLKTASARGLWVIKGSLSLGSFWWMSNFVNKYFWLMLVTQANTQPSHCGLQWRRLCLDGTKTLHRFLFWRKSTRLSAGVHTCRPSERLRGREDLGEGGVAGNGHGIVEPQLAHGNADKKHNGTSAIP